MHLFLRVIQDNPTPLKRTTSLSLCMVVWAAVVMLAAPAGSQKASPLEKFAGEVIQLNTAAHTIVIITEDRERVELTADPKLIRDIKVGNMVEFEKEGTRLKSIRVAEAPSVD